MNEFIVQGRYITTLYRAHKSKEHKNRIRKVGKKFSGQIQDLAKKTCKRINSKINSMVNIYIQKQDSEGNQMSKVMHGKWRNSCVL